MKAHTLKTAVFSPLGLLLLAAPAFAQKPVEVSSDGKLSVKVSETQNEDGGIAGPSAVPYGTAPDWQNTHHRQVGALQLADMNGDNLLDLVVGCFNSSSFPPYTDWRNMIYYNTGSQLQAEPSWVSADQVHTGDLQIADFNKDTYPDVFSVNGGFAHAPSVIYFGGPTGPSTVPGWQSVTPQSTWALSAAVFDFDHDGDVDVLTTNQSGIPNDNFRPLYLFRNNDGALETTPSWQSADAMISNGVGVGDYDNDGWEDIAVAKWVNFESAIYKNVKGTLQTLPIWTTGDDSGARGAIFGDIDGDDDLDLAFGYDPSRLYSNDNAALTPTWSSTAPFPSVQDMKFHDVDGDGDLDLAEQNFSTGRCHIYLNDGGALATSPSWTFDAPNVGNALAFGDINGDGCDDLALGYSGTPSIRIFYAICPEACPADINGDKAVNVDDLLAIINAWGDCPPSPPGRWAGGEGCPADINGDLIVNVDDLLAVINGWGPCS